MSDVPLGVFLSGGIDSSAIAGLMARRVRLQAAVVLVAFEDRACNELEYAREVAASIGAENHEVIVGERDFFGALPRLIWHEDEPIAHPSSRTRYFVSELARRHVKVVLTGEGSDELLAGYGRYPRALLNWRLRRRLRAPPCRRAAARPGRADRPPAGEDRAATRVDRSSPSSTRRTWRSSTTSPRSTWRGSVSCCRRGCGSWCAANAPTEQSWRPSIAHRPTVRCSITCSTPT